MVFADEGMEGGVAAAAAVVEREIRSHDFFAGETSLCSNLDDFPPKHCFLALQWWNCLGFFLHTILEDEAVSVR